MANGMIRCRNYEFKFQIFGIIEGVLIFICRYYLRRLSGFFPSKKMYA